MKNLILIIVIASFIGCAQSKPASEAQTNNSQISNAAAQPTPTVAEQFQAMGKMCADTDAARKARNKKSSLYKRLGGKAKIEKLIGDWLSLHRKNPVVAPFFAQSDDRTVAVRGASWISTNAGGPKTYKGPPLKATHGHRNISAEVFLAAGGDVMQAMKNNSYPEETIQDLMCLLGSKSEEIISEKK